MLVTTNGIVLHTLKYSDSSIIAKIYTETFGIQSYIVSGVRSSKAKMKAGLFQPLTLLELVVYHKNSAGLQRIKDLKITHPLHSIYANFSKNAIALFFSEILYKSLREETPNQSLFDFLNDSILYFELEEKGFSNFHLQFLAEYTQHLGFYPQIPATYAPSFFDLKLGCFSTELPRHSYYLSKVLSKLFYEVFTSAHNTSMISLTTLERRALIHALIKYYELHLTSFHDIKSHQILEQLNG
jgi:DNA repair protein RecO (recombination protein O)